MGALSLFMMAGGQTMQGIQKYRQLKKQKSSLKAQAAELDLQAKYTERMALRGQRELLEQEDITLGTQKARTAKAGLRVGGGSASARRKALSEKYGRARETIEMQASEEIRRLNYQAAILRKRAKEAKKASKWSKLTSLLAGGVALGIGLYGLGFFGGGAAGTAASTSGLGGMSSSVGGSGGGLLGGPTGLIPPV